MNTRMKVMVATASIAASVLLAAGCSSETKHAALPEPPAPTNVAVTVRGHRVAGLDFAVPTTLGVGKTLPASDAAADGPASASRPVNSAGAATRAFLGRAIAGDFTGAWTYLSATDRSRLAGPSALAEQFAAGDWTSYRLKSTADRAVLLDVVQTPRINEIVGLVAPTATVTLPTVLENGSYLVNWTRRTVVQHFPSRSEATDAQVRESVMRWARSRQQCTAPANEYANGVLGVIGLGEALCHTTDIEVDGDVNDLDALEEPESIIEGFGGSALSWARVVTLSGPIPMRVVAAPVANSWIVIGLARVSTPAP